MCLQSVSSRWGFARCLLKRITLERGSAGQHRASNFKGKALAWYAMRQRVSVMQSPMCSDYTFRLRFKIDKVLQEDAKANATSYWRGRSSTMGMGHQRLRCVHRAIREGFPHGAGTALEVSYTPWTSCCQRMSTAGGEDMVNRMEGIVSLVSICLADINPLSCNFSKSRISV